MALKVVDSSKCFFAPPKKVLPHDHVGGYTITHFRGSCTIYSFHVTSIIPKFRKLLLDVVVLVNRIFVYVKYSSLQICFWQQCVVTWNVRSRCFSNTR